MFGLFDLVQDPRLLTWHARWAAHNVQRRIRLLKRTRRA